MHPKAIVRTGYDRVSTTYRGNQIDLANPEHVNYVNWIAELRSLLSAPSPILDLGCGNGIPATRLLLEAGYTVTGVDLSPVQIERASQLVPAARLICADFAELSFAPASFAAIIAFYSLIHLPLEEQPGLFARMCRWLQPGGYLLATVGSSAWTGTEQDWLGVPGAWMYWSHADSATYQHWLSAAGLAVQWMRFVPEGQGGHTLLLAQRS